MKRKVIICLCAVMLIFTGCGKKTDDVVVTPEENKVEAESAANESGDKQNNSDTDVINSNNGNEANDTAEKMVYDDSLIGELISAKDTFKDEYDYVYEYSYQVPQILSENNGALQLNETIKSQIGTIVDSCFADMKEKSCPMVFDVHYETYWTDSLLSLLIIVRGECDYDDYYVYNYDFADDKLLTKEDLIEKAGMSVEEFIENAKASAVAKFDENNEYVWSGDYDDDESTLSMYYQYMMEFRSSSLHRVENMDENPVFMDQGNLKMLATLETPAGSGIYHAVCDVSKYEDKGITKSVSSDFVHADLSNNEITISFEDTADARDYISDLSDELIKGMKVKGLHSHYKDIFMGIMGQDFYPFLFLITEGDAVEMVNIMDCARAGYFCAIPVPGKYKADTFEEKVIEDEYSSYVSVTAVNSFGKERDFSTCLFYARSAMSTKYTYDYTWNSNIFTYTHNGKNEEKEYSFSFSQSETMYPYLVLDSITDGDMYERVEGTMSFIGVSDDGYLYDCYLHTEDFGKNISCFFLFNFGTPYYETLPAQEIGSTYIFQDSDEWMYLSQAFG